MLYVTLSRGVIWMFPKIVVPPNHPLQNRVFHYIHHPFWVFLPIFGNTHIEVLLVGSFLLFWLGRWPVPTTRAMTNESRIDSRQWPLNDGFSPNSVVNAWGSYGSVFTLLGDNFRCEHFETEVFNAPPKLFLESRLPGSVL